MNSTLPVVLSLPLTYTVPYPLVLRAGPGRPSGATYRWRTRSLFASGKLSTAGEHAFLLASGRWPRWGRPGPHLPPANVLKQFASGILSTTGEPAASSPVVTWSFHFNSTSPHLTPLLHLTLPFTLAQTYPIKSPPPHHFPLVLTNKN